MAYKVSKKKLIKLCDMLLKHWGEEVYVFGEMPSIILVVDENIAQKFLDDYMWGFKEYREGDIRYSKMHFAICSIYIENEDRHFFEDIDEILGGKNMWKHIDLFLVPPFWQLNANSWVMFTRSRDIFENEVLKNVLRYDPYAKKFKK